MAVRLDAGGVALARAALARVPFNTLFASHVLERAEAGDPAAAVMGDDAADPRVFLVVHPNTMALMWSTGEPRPGWLAWLRDVALGRGGVVRAEPLWLQCHPSHEWDALLSGLVDIVPMGLVDLPAGAVWRSWRVNFEYSGGGLAAPAGAAECGEGAVPAAGAAAATTAEAEDAPHVVRCDAELFGRMDGGTVPKAYWSSADEFLRGGVGFCVLRGGRLSATAFSGFRRGALLEIGIETIPEFRGRGDAARAVAALVEHCVSAGLEPIWACRDSNVASYRLAERCGFREVLRVPYYRLPGGT